MSNAIFILPVEVEPKRAALTEFVCTVCLGLIFGAITAFLFIGWVDESLKQLGF